MASRISLCKLLLLILCLFIAPIELCNIGIAKWGFRTMQEQQSNFALSKMNYVMSELDNKALSIRYHMDTLLQNSDVITFAHQRDNKSASVYYSTIKEVQGLLNDVKRSEPIISDIRIYYPKLSVQISSSRKTPIDIKQTDIENRIAAYKSKGSVFIRNDEQLTMGYLPPQQSAISALPSFYIECDINLSRVRSILSVSVTDDFSNCYLLYHPTDTVFLPQAVASSFDKIESLNGIIAKNSPSIENVLRNQTEYIRIAVYSQALKCELFQLVPLSDVFSVPNRFLTIEVFFSSLLIILTIIFFLSIRRIVKKPIDDIRKGFEITRSGQFDIRLNGSYIHEYALLAESFNYTNEKIEELIRSNYESVIRCQEAELKQLSAQINPHFLYNSFYILKHNIRHQHYQYAEKMADYLGDYFRFITDQSSDVIPLSLEYEHAKTYLKIQELRYDGFFQTESEPLPEALQNIIVPRLIIQPLFENAVKYGMPIGDEDAYLRIRFSIAEHDFYIYVDDNGNQLTDKTLTSLKSDLYDEKALRKNYHALANIHRRLEIFFGHGYGLSLDRSKLGGLEITIKLHI